MDPVRAASLLIALALGLIPPIAARATPLPPLLVEPMSEEWRERLVGPMLARFSPIGPREVVDAAPSDALARVVADEQAVAIMRRSQVLGVTTTQPIEYLELGPAACLALVAQGRAPFGSYAELNYADPKRPLRVLFGSEGAQDLFDRMRDQFPLAVAAETEKHPPQVGLQRLSIDKADLLVLEVPRLSRSGVPAERAVAALARGHRLLDLPGTTPEPHTGLLPGEVQVDDPPFWRRAATYHSFCDPFVLVLRREAADRTLHRLYSTPVPTSSEQSFLDQMLSAAKGLGTIIATRLPL
jgi:hypothetical protein